MKLLVIGRGGREHAIAYHLLKSSQVETVYCAPGNPAMTFDGIECVDINENDFADLVNFAKEKQVDWTFVGPEIPLFDGIVDYFEASGQIIFGPDQAASQIEGSKLFAKKLMDRHRIPTAKYASFTDLEASLEYLENQDLPIVVKVDGPAAGKGVTVAQTLAEAQTAVKEAFTDFQNTLSKDSESKKKNQCVVIEECMVGPEYSIFSFVYNGVVFHSLPAKDHKRQKDGDQGPNTGGMGAFTPVDFISEADYQRSLVEIVEPVLVALEKEGVPFNGVLYTGLMLCEDGPKVIEFNARLGDPETQVVLPLLKNDFAQVIDDLIHGRPFEVSWHEDKTCLGVVLAAEGYPHKPVKGIEFELAKVGRPGMKIYYAGVSAVDPFVSQGGRLAMVTQFSDNKEQARQSIYDYLGNQELSQIFYRKDIGV